MSEIRPFQVSIEQQALEDLQARLALTRLPEKETPDDWAQGIPLGYMQEILSYWQDATTGAGVKRGSTSFRSSSPRSTVWTSTSSTSAHQSRPRSRWC